MDRFELAFQHSPVGMAIVGLDGSFLHANPSLADLLGYDEVDLVRFTFQELTHPDDLDADLEQLDECLSGERDSYRMDKRYYHRLGHVVWADLSVVLVRDETGSPLYFISQLQDITERRYREEELEVQARIDPLTGLANRTAAQELLGLWLAEDRAFGLVFCDLAEFKSVNDRYGHIAGDQVLRTVARRMSSTLRPDHDLIARWGGDEFVVLTPIGQSGTIAALQQRLVDALEEPVVLPTGPLRVDITVGWAVHQPGRHESSAELLHRADAHMYRQRGTVVEPPSG